MSLFDFIRKFAPHATPPNISLTPRAQQVLQLAHENAAREGRDIPNSSDLVVGLLGLGQGVAWNVLNRFGVTKVTMNSTPATKTLLTPYTELLPVAEKEMRSMHHTYLGTEHLFLAILSDRNSPLSLLLSEKGISTAILREEILRELDPNYSPPPVE